METKHYCRLCLEQSANLLWVFDQRFEANNHLKDLIFKTTGVEISQTDAVSQKICHKCGDNVVKLYEFRQQSLKNDKFLKEQHKAQKRTPHRSILNLFQKYPRILIPDLEVCLSQDFSPVVEMRMDEVENYFKSKNLDIHKHVVQVLRQEKQKQRAINAALKSKTINTTNETVSPISLKYRQDKSSYEIVQKKDDDEPLHSNNSLKHSGNHRKRQLSDCEQSCSKRSPNKNLSSALTSVPNRRQSIGPIQFNIRPGPSDLDSTLLEALEVSENQKLPLIPAKRSPEIISNILIRPAEVCRNVNDTSNNNSSKFNNVTNDLSSTENNLRIDNVDYVHPVPVNTIYKEFIPNPSLLHTNPNSNHPVKAKSTIVQNSVSRTIVPNTNIVVQQFIPNQILLYPIVSMPGTVLRIVNTSSESLGASSSPVPTSIPESTTEHYIVAGECLNQKSNIESQPKHLQTISNSKVQPEFTCNFCRESFATGPMSEAHLETCRIKKEIEIPSYVSLEKIENNVDVKRKYHKVFRDYARNYSNAVIEILDEPIKIENLVLNLSPQVEIKNSNFPNVNYTSNTTDVLKTLLAFDKNESPVDQDSQTDKSSFKTFPNEDSIHPRTNYVSMDCLKQFVHLYKIPVSIGYKKSLEVKYKLEEPLNRKKILEDWDDLTPIDVIKHVPAAITKDVPKISNLPPPVLPNGNGCQNVLNCSTGPTSDQSIRPSSKKTFDNWDELTPIDVGTVIKHVPATITKDVPKISNVAPPVLPNGNVCQAVLNCSTGPTSNQSIHPNSKLKELLRRKKIFDNWNGVTPVDIGTVRKQDSAAITADVPKISSLTPPVLPNGNVCHTVPNFSTSPTLDQSIRPNSKKTYGIARKQVSAAITKDVPKINNLAPPVLPNGTVCHTVPNFSTSPTLNQSIRPNSKKTFDNWDELTPIDVATARKHVSAAITKDVPKISNLAPPVLPNGTVCHTVPNFSTSPTLDQSIRPNSKKTFDNWDELTPIDVGIARKQVSAAITKDVPKISNLVPPVLPNGTVCHTVPNFSTSPTLDQSIRPNSKKTFDNWDEVTPIDVATARKHVSAAITKDVPKINNLAPPVLPNGTVCHTVLNFSTNPTSKQSNHPNSNMNQSAITNVETTDTLPDLGDLELFANDLINAKTSTPSNDSIQPYPNELLNNLQPNYVVQPSMYQHRTYPTTYSITPGDRMNGLETNYFETYMNRQQSQLSNDLRFRRSKSCQTGQQNSSVYVRSHLPQLYKINQYYPYGQNVNQNLNVPVNVSNVPDNINYNFHATDNNYNGGMQISSAIMQASDSTNNASTIRVRPLSDLK